MAIFVFNQNLKIDSLKLYRNLADSENLFVTTNLLFKNEIELLNSIFPGVTYKTFADYLSDEEMESIDENSYFPSIKKEHYLRKIKQKKNKIIITKILSKHNTKKRYIFSDGLGIDAEIWLQHGFKFICCEYYYAESFSWKRVIKNKIKRIPGIMYLKNHMKNEQYVHDPSEVFVAYYHDRKYVFLGNMSRISYRLNIDFKNSKEECERLNRGEFEQKDSCTYFTTWHEQGKCNVPDDVKYEVRWAQDGYLPPNYSHKDYFFKPNNVKYYCWDTLGTQLFRNQGLQYEMIPFRKKLYLPKPVFPKVVNNVLIVASGSGDWTALKNRSDDDIMVEAFVEMAKKFPKINFTFRCHPTWVLPSQTGVNSINRVAEYFRWVNIPNLVLSSNIPLAQTESGISLSFNRSSLDDDLKQADFVFGEHSISMIDSAFKGIPFASVNLTNRRNFFVGINDLGFPSCSSLEDIEKMISGITTDEFQTQFISAVENYNKMTDAEW